MALEGMSGKVVAQIQARGEKTVDLNNLSNPLDERNSHTLSLGSTADSPQVEAMWQEEYTPGAGGGSVQYTFGTGAGSRIADPFGDNIAVDGHVRVLYIKNNSAAGSVTLRTDSADSDLTGGWDGAPWGEGALTIGPGGEALLVDFSGDNWDFETGDDFEIEADASFVADETVDVVFLMDETA